MRWANENPERMAEIAALPLNQQNAALREAIGYDPDRIRDEHSAHVLGERDNLPRTSPRVQAGPPNAGRSGVRGKTTCEVCGAPEDMPCEPWCRSEQVSR